MAKIYVSSTFLDLQEHRTQVERVIRRMGHEDVAMEYYVAEDQRPVVKCLSDVAACDVYVGIFAWRYGWQPKENNPENLSITEIEIRQAEKSGKPCLIFLLSDDAPWFKKHMDKDTTKIENLRNIASAHHTPDYFSTPDELARKVAESIYKCIPAAVPILEHNLDAYYSALRKRYSVLALEGLTPPQKEEYLQIQLRSVFVEQNVRENPPPVELPKEVWEKLSRDKEIHPEDLPAGITLDDVRKAREAYYEKPTRPVLEVLTDARYQHAIILGDPGSGKSTLARYVMLSLIDRDAATITPNISRLGEGVLPLLIELRSYARLIAENKCETFLEFLEYLGKTEGWGLTKIALENYLKNDGRAVVMFDGLDEIFDAELRERIAHQIVGFAGDYPKSRIIVTSRVIGYRRKILTDAGFTHFTLQDLDEKQVETFVSRWYDLAMSERRDEAKERRERILRSFKESASIRALAGNPMLLTIMAIIGKHQELPRERWKLYDHAASVLIQHWDVNKHLKDARIDADFIGEDDKKELLRRLAFRMQSGEGGLAGNYIHRDQLQAEFEDYLKTRYAQPPDRAAMIARAMIEQFRERNFILSLYGANLYGFVHRAFLEFFCASAFKYRFAETQEIDIEYLKQEVYGKHWEDQSWHEVLRLICGMIAPRFTGEIIDYLTRGLNQLGSPSFKAPPWNIALAVQCLGEVRDLSAVDEPAGRLLQAVCASLSDLWNVSEYLGDERFNVYKEFMEKHIAHPAAKIGTAWPHRELLTDWVKKYNGLWGFWYCRDAFAIFVGSIGSGIEQIHQTLLGYAQDRDEDVRALALRTLVEGWRDKQTLAAVSKLAKSDSYSDIREEAVKALAEHFRGNGETLLVLRDRAINDSRANVRSAAIKALVEYIGDEPQTVTLLRERAESDPIEELRQAAIVSLAEDFHDDARTLPFLRHRSVNDSSANVRRMAIALLAEHFGDDVQTLSLIHDDAVNHADAGIRMAAVEALAKHHRDDPQTISLVRDRAINDEIAEVRRVALWSLGEQFSHDLRSSVLLRDRAVNDVDDNVRFWACWAYVECLRHSQEALPLVWDRVANDKNGLVRSQVATLVLADYFRYHPKTLPLLRDRAINDESYAVRADIIYWFVEYFWDAPETLVLLQDRAVNDTDSTVRYTAIKAVIEHFRSDPLTLSLLCDRATNDEDEFIRYQSVSALAKYFHDDPKAYSTVCDRAAKDDSPSADSEEPTEWSHYVRLRAMYALAESGWAKNPSTSLLLKERAENDPTPWLRKRAKRLADELEAKAKQE